MVWFIASSLRCLVDLLIHHSIGSFIDSVNCVRFFSFLFIGISTTICSFVDAPRNFNASLNFCVSKIFLKASFSYSSFLSSKFPPWHGPVSIGTDTGWGVQRFARKDAHIHAHAYTARGINHYVRGRLGKSAFSITFMVSSACTTPFIARSFCSLAVGWDLVDVGVECCFSLHFDGGLWQRTW